MIGAKVISHPSIQDRIRSCNKLLTTGEIVNPHELGRLRGILEAFRMIENLEKPPAVAAHEQDSSGGPRRVP